ERRALLAGYALDGTATEETLVVVDPSHPVPPVFQITVPVPMATDGPRPDIVTVPKLTIDAASGELVTIGRSSLVYVKDGKIYRLSLFASAAEPPVPLQVSALPEPAPAPEPAPGSDNRRTMAVNIAAIRCR